MVKIALISALASTLILASGDVETEQQTTSPKVPMSIALIGGTMNNNVGDKYKAMYGVEFSFACLFFDKTRSQLQITNYNSDGVKMLQVSANPHYLFNLTKDTSIGVGPSLGVAKVEVNNQKDTIYTYGLGASITTYVYENFFVGAETHYELTTDAKFHGVKKDFDNAKFFAKAGYSF